MLKHATVITHTLVREHIQHHIMPVRNTRLDHIDTRLSNCNCSDSQYTTHHSPDTKYTTHCNPDMYTHPSLPWHEVYPYTKYATPHCPDTRYTNHHSKQTTPQHPDAKYRSAIKDHNCAIRIFVIHNFSLPPPPPPPPGGDQRDIVMTLSVCLCVQCSCFPVIAYIYHTHHNGSDICE